MYNEFDFNNPFALYLAEDIRFQIENAEDEIAKLGPANEFTSDLISYRKFCYDLLKQQPIGGLLNEPV